MDGRPPPDRGSGVADFVLVSGLVSLLFLAVFQVGLALYVRNTLIECASDGARFGARADNQPLDGAQRAADLVRLSLADRYAADVSTSTATVAGVKVVDVRIVAPLPVVGMFGPSGDLVVHGRAFAEVQ